jgi:hypothetical protein
MSRVSPSQLRRALVLAVAVIMITPTVTFAAVTTDQEDYSPGSVVTISGDSTSGATYVEGNTVDVAVTGPVSDGYPDGWQAQCSAIVAEDGTWTCQITLDSDPDVAVGDYTYTATQRDADDNVISSETGTFTDGVALDINAKNPNANSRPWHRTVAGGFDVTVSGTWGCSNSNPAPLCFSPISVVVEVFPDGSSTAEATRTVGSLTGATWTTTFEFRTSPGGGQFPIPSDGLKDVKATFNYNLATCTGSGPSRSCSDSNNDGADDLTSDKHFGVDNTAPSVAITGITYPTLTTVRPAGTASDATSGVKNDEVSVVLNKVGGGIEEGPELIPLTGSPKENWATTGDPATDFTLPSDPGTYCFVASVEDVAGNTNSTTTDTTGDHCFTVEGAGEDEIDPEVAITAPVNGASLLPSEYIALCAVGTPEICGTASDADSGLKDVAGVEARIRWNDGTDDLWFDGTDFDGNITEVWNDVTGSLVGDDWSLGFDPYTALGYTDDATIWEGYVSETFVATARAVDDADNDAQTDPVSFTVAKADVSVVYTGSNYVVQDGVPLALSAVVTSDEESCESGVTVVFTVDGTLIYSGLTDSDGVATADGPTEPGIYEVEVTVDESLDCRPASSATVVSVVSPGDAANGGGWYQNFYGDGSPRINFGFTVRRDCGSTADPCSNYTAENMPYKGQFLAINNGQWRLKGTLDYFGNTDCPSISGWSGVCGSVRGAGDLFSWDQSLDGGLGDWVLEDAVTFTVGVYDGGSSKRRGDRPDYAGILTITGYDGDDDLPLSLPLVLKGGNVTLSAAVSEAPATSGGRKGGGGKTVK